MLGQFKSLRAPGTFPDATVSAGRAGDQIRQARRAYRSLVMIVKVVGMTQDSSVEISYWLRNGFYDGGVWNTTSHRNTCEASM
jgi:hypothetical protein